MRWLAEVSGVEPGDILADPRVFGAAIGTAADEMADWVRRLNSPDPTLRATAKAEAARLRTEMSADPSPGVRFRTRIQNMLDQTLRDLREQD